VAEDLELRKLVADVAAAYFGNSHVTPSEIPTVISQIANSLSAIGAPAVETPEEPAAPAKPSPAQVRRSITREALISFEDNKPYKTLRRHLAVRGLSPEQYRAKWGLPKDYPMVAPAYSEARSSLARALGLGSRVTAAPAPDSEAETPPKARAKTPRAAPARGRKPRSAAGGRGGAKAE
jgi:predicted transcriptional regulator